MRNGASVSHDLQVSVLPRGARMTRDASWREEALLEAVMTDIRAETGFDYRTG
jgi:hypothetical protein